MNETLKLIKERFSCRAFTNEVPTSEELDAIAQAGVQAPSGMNRQGWQIIVVRDKELISEMELEGTKNLREYDKSLFKRIEDRGGKLFYNAPCIIIVAIKPSTPTGSELVDLGIVAQNIVLAAESLRLNTLHCGFAAFVFAGTKKDYFEKKLKFLAGYECGIGVLIGHAESKREAHEPDLSKITIIK